MARILTKYVIEYYKAYGRPPGFEFKENPPAKLDKDEPKEVIDNLKQREKKLVTTKKWDDIDSEAHDKAFTVANIMKADILQEIYNEVEKAAKNGKPFKDFMNSVIDGGLKDRMKEAGWTGGDNPSRLKVIWDTNINMAYAKEEYKAMKLVADEKPYWIYHQIERANKNKDHTQWNGRKFKHDDPIWNYIYPPSKFGCACWVEATDDPTGCESSKSLNLDVIAKNVQISPLKSWQPDTTKYVDGIREQLQQMIGSKAKDNKSGSSIPDSGIEKFKTDKEAQGVAYDAIMEDQDFLDTFKDLDVSLSVVGSKLSDAQYIQFMKEIDTKNGKQRWVVYTLRLANHFTTEKWDQRPKNDELLFMKKQDFSDTDYAKLSDIWHEWKKLNNEKGMAVGERMSEIKQQQAELESKARDVQPETFFQVDYSEIARAKQQAIERVKSIETMDDISKAMSKDKSDAKDRGVRVAIREQEEAKQRAKDRDEMIRNGKDGAKIAALENQIMETEDKLKKTDSRDKETRRALALEIVNLKNDIVEIYKKYPLDARDIKFAENEYGILEMVYEF